MSDFSRWPQFLHKLSARQGSHCAALMMTLVAAAMLYFSGISDLTMLDDGPTLGRLLANPPAIRDAPAFLWSSTGPSGRPVTMATFLANVLTTGGDIPILKVTNIALHLVTALLIYFLISTVAAVGSSGIGSSSRWFGVVVAGLWVIHPLHVSTVLYTVQRMTILSSLFSVLGMLLYVCGRRRMIRGARGGEGLCMASLGPITMVAFLSKENGALLPLLAFGIEALCFKFEKSRKQRRFLLVAFGSYLVILVGAAVLIYLQGRSDIVFGGYKARDFDVEERLLTEARALWVYVGWILVPALDRFGFFHDDFPASRGWLEPPETLLAVAAWLMVVAIAWYQRSRQPLVVLGLWLFLVGHLVESTVLPLELVFEHRNYLPSLGIILAVASVGQRLRIGVRLAGVGLWTALLAFVAAVHVSAWSNEAEWLTFVYRAHPESPRAAALVAERLVREGRPKVALKVLGRVRHVGATLHGMQIQCEVEGQLADDSIRHAISVLPPAIDSYTASGLMELGASGLEDRCNFNAKVFLELIDAAKERPSYNATTVQKLHLYRAQYLWRTGDKAETMRELERGFSVDSKNPVPLLLAAELSLDGGDVAGANQYFDRAVAILTKESTIVYRNAVDRVSVRLGRTGSKSIGPAKSE